MGGVGIKKIRREHLHGPKQVIWMETQFGNQLAKSRGLTKKPPTQTIIKQKDTHMATMLFIIWLLSRKVSDGKRVVLYSGTGCE